MSGRLLHIGFRAFRPALLSYHHDESDRDTFYLVSIASLLIEHGVSVVFDATANRWRYRERARREISCCLEVGVDPPQSVCIDRDPKGIYQRGMAGETNSVPGLGAAYEPPIHADVTVDGSDQRPEDASDRILEALVQGGDTFMNRCRRVGALRDRTVQPCLPEHCPGIGLDSELNFPQPDTNKATVQILDDAQNIP